MKKVVTLFTVVFITLATIAPANAWYRGGWGGGYYGGGWGYNPGAAWGVAAGAALLGGALAAGAYSQQRYYGYGTQCPIYDAWGNFLGYQYC